MKTSDKALNEGNGDLSYEVPSNYGSAKISK